MPIAAFDALRGAEAHCLEQPWRSHKRVQGARSTAEALGSGQAMAASRSLQPSSNQCLEKVLGQAPGCLLLPTPPGFQGARRWPASRDVCPGSRRPAATQGWG